MNRRFLSALVLVLTGVAISTFSACKRDTSVAPKKKPIVEVAPVFTRPYDDGYKAGFEKGHAAAEPRVKLPSEAEVNELAAQAAGVDPELQDKWPRGWAEGYMDGFRAVAQGKK